MHKELSLRPFDDLLSSIGIDLKVLEGEGMIEPAQLVKVALKCNADLGLRIHKPKETILEVSHGSVRLPEDFYSLSFAMICGGYEVSGISYPSGGLTEQVDTECTDTPILTDCQDPMFQRTVFSVCGDSCVKVIERCVTETRTYSVFEKLNIKKSKNVDPSCMSQSLMTPNSAYIQDKFLRTSFDCGKVFISYLGAMEDEQGNLLIPDHPKLNEYYDTATKERIFENLWYAGEDFQQKLRYASEKKREAFIVARNYVMTPNFSELLDMWQKNRKQTYASYFDTFKTNLFDKWRY